MSEGKSRNYNLDLIKILACLAVVGLHSLNGNGFPVIRVAYYSCGFSVPAFFAASGYVLLNKAGIGYGYSFKKILNIIKIAIIWAFIVVSFQWLGGALSGNFANPLSLLLSVPKVAFYGFVFNGPLWHFWYLGALIIIYLVLPIFHKTGDNLIWLWVLSLLFCIFSFYLAYILGSDRLAITNTFQVWWHFQYFMLGGLLGRIDIKAKLKSVPLWLHLVVLIVYSLLYALLRMSIEKVFPLSHIVDSYYCDIFSVFWIVLIFSFFLRIPLCDFSKRCISFIAPLTMGVYIVHPLLRHLAQIYLGLDVYLLFSRISVVLYYIGLVSASIFVSFVISKIPVLNRIIKL